MFRFLRRKRSLELKIPKDRQIYIDDYLIKRNFSPLSFDEILNQAKNEMERNYIFFLYGKKN